MKYVPRLTGRAVSCILAVVLVNSLEVANAEIQSGQVLVQAVHGSATYSVSGGQTLPVKENLVLTRGATIKTPADATVDLILQYNGTVLRLLPGSTLKFDKLNKESASEATITETSLNLVAGSILGSQRKLATPSTFEVNIPGGVATIKGTEYVVRADGAVSVLSGSVQVHYNLRGNGGSVKVNVPAGFSFNPATGKVVATSPEFLQNLIADIDTVRNNAKVFKTGGATVIVKPESVLSPTRGNSGNESSQGDNNNQGQGNQGNPGNRYHTKTKVR